MSTDDVIEQAARVLCALDHCDPDALIWDRDDFGRATTSEPAWVYYAPSAQALADAGLLARPLPSRDDIAEVIEAEILDFFDWPGLHPDLPLAAADAVLELLKGKNQ